MTASSQDSEQGVGTGPRRGLETAPREPSITEKIRLEGLLAEKLGGWFLGAAAAKSLVVHSEWCMAGADIDIRIDGIWREVRCIDLCGEAAPTRPGSIASMKRLDCYGAVVTREAFYIVKQANGP